MTEIENLIKERYSEIEQLMEELEIEDSKEIIELLTHHYNTLPKSNFFPPDKRFKRAISFVMADLSSMGVKVGIAIFGHTDPRDWNEIERNKVLADWEKGVVAQQKLIDEGKVMVMKTRDGLKAVSKIQETVTDDEGVLQVIKGVIVEGEEKPIPRDHHKTLGKGDKTWDNNHYSRALGKRWGMTTYGLTNDGEKDVKFIMNTNYNKWANPSSSDYLLTKAPAFGFYDATVIINEDKSTSDCLVFNALSAIVPKKVLIEEEMEIDGKLETVERPLLMDEYIFGLIDSDHRPIKDFREYIAADEADREAMKDDFFLVDGKHFSEFMDFCARRDKEGNIVKTDKGTIYSTFGIFGIGVMVCKEITLTSNGNQQLSLVASGSKKCNAFLRPTFPTIELDGSHECLISFTLSKKSTRYDFKTRKQVEDPANGDIQINNILGFKKTFKLV